MLDAADRLGGKLRRERVAGTLVDVGAESMLARRPEGLALVGVGAGALLTHPVTTASGVWSRGALPPLPKGTLMGVPSDPESARGLLTDDEVARAADEQPWPAGGLEADVAVGDYVGARLGTAVVDRLVEPLLGGVYAGHADRLSLQACRAGPVRGGPRGGQPDRRCARSRRIRRRNTSQPGLRRASRVAWAGCRELLCATACASAACRSAPGSSPGSCTPDPAAAGPS